MCGGKYAVDQISVDPRSEKAYVRTQKRLEDLVEIYNNSPESKEISNSLDEQRKKQKKQRKQEKQEGVKEQIELVKRSNILKVISILTSRSYTNLSRNPLIIFTRMAQVISFGIILSLCYLRIKDDQIGIKNMQGFLYECLALLFVGLLNAVAICSFLFFPFPFYDIFIFPSPFLFPSPSPSPFPFPFLSFLSLLLYIIIYYNFVSSLPFPSPSPLQVSALLIDKNQ